MGHVFRYLFLVDDWLSIEQGDGQTTRRVKLSSKDDVTNSNDLLGSNVKHQFFDDHIWLSVGYRKTRSSFTRVQRLCCCMSILYLMMITNAMWFGRGNATGNQAAIVIGPISVTVMQVYASFMSSLIVLPPIFVMTSIFSRLPSRRKNNSSTYAHLAYSASERANLNRKQCLLPWWTIFLAYTLVVLTIAASAFFTILYAFEWGKSKSEQWLVTFIFGFLESVVIVQPIKVCFIGWIENFKI